MKFINVDKLERALNNLYNKIKSKFATKTELETHTHKYAASESVNGGASGVKVSNDTSNKLYLTGVTATTANSGTIRTSSPYMAGSTVTATKFVAGSFESNSSYNGTTSYTATPIGMSYFETSATDNGSASTHSTTLTVKSIADRQFQLCANNTGTVLAFRTGHINNTGGSGTGWSVWRKIYHEQNKPTPADIGAAPASHGTHVTYGGNGSATTVSRSDHTHSNYASTSPLSNTSVKITVKGDADKYYPVLLTIDKPGIGYPYYHICVSRAYNATAPDTWNNSTHKGGLTFSFRWSGDTGWGGNDHAIRVDEFNENYTTMVAGFALTVSGIVVWLRGGTAEYQINCEQGLGLKATVTIGTYTASDDKTYPVRTNTNNVTNEIYKYWHVRQGGLFDNNNRVYSASNKPAPADIGAAAASHGTHVSYGGNGSATTVSRSDHTHSYLPLSGGTMTGSIKSSSAASSWVASMKNSICMSTKAAGSFNPMLSSKTTNGGMTLAFYNNTLCVGYVTQANIDSNTNTVKICTLYDENGNASWPGTATANSLNCKSLYFNIDRPWQFTSDGTGANNRLLLQSTSNDKTFAIMNMEGTKSCRFISSTTGMNMEIDGYIKPSVTYISGRGVSVTSSAPSSKSTGDIWIQI